MMREAQPDGAPDGAALVAVETNLLEANGALEPERQAEMGQYLTPPPVARFMASLLGLGRSSVRVLDADAPDHMIHLNGIRYLGPYGKSAPSDA